ncbi:MAG: SRPBCC domain-containing protein [Deltaproteobacteria bacterium]|nr:MAG: SRPBCC domain-containing protein [Deltaproteobacteria bacterium]
MINRPDSLRIARTFAAPRERLYRAWTDAAEMARWYSPADGMTLSIDALEVRVGGRYQATSGMPGETPFVEAGEYRKVEPGRLLEFDMSLARGGTVFSRTRCTVEFLDRGVGTQLVLTDEGDGAGEHATGWGPALDHLAQLLG